jgi:PAS domain-containing protein
VISGENFTRPGSYAWPMVNPPRPTPVPSAEGSASSPGEALVLLRQIASNIEAMLWSWDPRDGRITYTNPAFEAFWGMSADTLADTPWQ